MLDKYSRQINYLRVSVTDRCNLDCVYCRNEEKINFIKRDRILSLDKIREVVQVAVELGFDKIRLTGGEPLLRNDIVKLVSMISSIDGINDFSLTTNGTLLSRYAEELKTAGLMRVNISLDTIDRAHYTKITGHDMLDAVLEGIESARRAGLLPIKINCVIEESSDEPDAKLAAEFAKKNNYEIRYINRMNLKTGRFKVVSGGNGGKCDECSRLRLTSDGRIIPCLFSDISFDINEYGIREALIKAVESKPVSGKKSIMNNFYTVGG